MSLPVFVNAGLRVWSSIVQQELSDVVMQGVSLPNEYAETREMGGRLAREQLKMKLPEFAGRTGRQTSGKTPLCPLKISTIH